MTEEEYIKLVDECITKLGDHFEAVQILVSWSEEAICKNMYRGGGNWYARQGMAHDFITQDVAQENAAHIARKLEPPQDDAEAWKKE